MFTVNIISQIKLKDKKNVNSIVKFIFTDVSSPVKRIIKIRKN